MPRKATPTGGPGHPFEHGDIHLDLAWDGALRLTASVGGTLVPHHLTDWNLQQIKEHTDAIRLIVYRAQWRAAYPPEPQPEPEPEPVEPSPYDIAVRTLPTSAASLTWKPNELEAAEAFTSALDAFVLRRPDAPPWEEVARLQQEFLNLLDVHTHTYTHTED